MLLPVTKRPERKPEGLRKLGLRQSEPLTRHLHTRDALHSSKLFIGQRLRVRIRPRGRDHDALARLATAGSSRVGALPAPETPAEALVPALEPARDLLLRAGAPSRPACTFARRAATRFAWAAASGAFCPGSAVAACAFFSALAARSVVQVVTHSGGVASSAVMPAETWAPRRSRSRTHERGAAGCMRSPPPDPGEEVREASAARGCFEVVEIDGGPARRKYPTDVAKLLFGDLASGPKPAELLQDDILRTQDREHAADRHFGFSGELRVDLFEPLAATDGEWLWHRGPTGAWSVTAHTPVGRP